jgi:hypothetical protein
VVISPHFRVQSVFHPWLGVNNQNAAVEVVSGESNGPKFFSQKYSGRTSESSVTRRRPAPTLAGRRGKRYSAGVSAGIPEGW